MFAWSDPNDKKVKQIRLEIVFAINNIAGVFFVKDLFSEIKSEQKKQIYSKQKDYKNNQTHLIFRTVGTIYFSNFW